MSNFLITIDYITKGARIVRSIADEDPDVLKDKDVKELIVQSLGNETYNMIRDAYDKLIQTRTDL